MFENMSYNISKLRKVRDKLKECQLLEMSQHKAIRNFREKTVNLERHILKVMNLERYFDLVERIIYNSTKSIVNNNSNNDNDDNKYISSFQAKPFGYSHEMCYKDLLNWYRQYPYLLSYAIHHEYRDQSLNGDQSDQLARAIVFDVYGEEYKKELLIMITKLIELTGAAERNQLLSHNSFPFKLLHQYLMFDGNEYLKLCLQNTVNRIVVDNDLNVDLIRPLNSSSDSIDDDNSSNSDEPGQSPGGNVLFMICAQMLRRILSSISLLPYGVRIIAKTLANVQWSNDKNEYIISEEQSSLIGDFVFLSWIVHAINWPEQYRLLQAAIITPIARQNLQVVGTVIIKLLTRSRFTAYEQRHLNGLNLFLDEMEPQVHEYLHNLVKVPSINSQYFEQEYNQMNKNKNDNQIDDELPKILRIIAMKPNDLFAMHQLAVNAFSDFQVEKNKNELIFKDIFQSCAKSLSDWSALQDRLVKNTKPKYISENVNDYILLDLDLPQLEVIPFKDNDDSIDKETQDCVIVLKSIINSLPELNCNRIDVMNEKNSTLVEILKGRGDMSQLLEQPSVAGLVTEGCRIIEESKMYIDDGYWPLVDILLEQCQKRLSSLRSSKVSENLIYIQGAMNNFIEKLFKREKQIKLNFSYIQLRRIIDSTHSKILALSRWLHRRNEVNSASKSSNQQNNPRWALCGGVCPCDLQNDQFLCQKCQSILEQNKSTMLSFAERYIIAPQEVLSWPAGLIDEPLNVKDPSTLRSLMDYVITMNYQHLFVYCKAADDRFYQLLTQLSKQYTSLDRFGHALIDNSPSPTSTSNNNKIFKLPNIGKVAIDACIVELTKINKTVSIQKKVEALMKCRNIILTMLEHTNNLPSRLKDTEIALSGADAYMPILCYVILLANPVRFLSNIELIHVLDEESLSVKAFVDVLVAIKYLSQLQIKKQKTKNSNKSKLISQDNNKLLNRDNSISSNESLSKQSSLPSTTISSPITATVNRKLRNQMLTKQQLKHSMLEMGFQERFVDSGLQVLEIISDEHDIRMDGGAYRLLDFLTCLSKLVDMGYKHEQCVVALSRTRGGIERAIRYMESNDTNRMEQDLF